MYFYTGVRLNIETVILKYFIALSVSTVDPNGTVYVNRQECSAKYDWLD